MLATVGHLDAIEIDIFSPWNFAPFGARNGYEQSGSDGTVVVSALALNGYLFPAMVHDWKIDLPTRAAGQ